MAKVGAVSITVTAHTDKFEKGMKRAAKSVKSLQKPTQMTTKSIGRLAKSMVGFAGLSLGVGVLASKMNSMMDAARTSVDTMAKFAQRIGVTTAKLQELRFAALDTGVAAGTLDMALQRSVRRISEAAAGTGEAKDAIKELGLDARTLAAMTPDKAFHAIADAMKEIVTQGDRVRLSFKLYDSEGVALVNTLALGSEGLKKMADEARNLGAVLSSTTIKEIEKLQSEAAKTNAILQAGVAAVATQFGDPIDAYKRVFGGGLAMLASFGKTLETEGARNVLSSGERLLGAFAKNDATRGSLTATDFFKAKKLREEQEEMAATVSKLKLQKIDEAAATKKAAEAQKVWNREQQKGLSIVQSLRSPMERTIDRAKELAGAMRADQITAGQFVWSMRRLIGRAGKGMTPSSPSMTIAANDTRLGSGILGGTQGAAIARFQASRAGFTESETIRTARSTERNTGETVRQLQDLLLQITGLRHDVAASQPVIVGM